MSPEGFSKLLQAVKGDVTQVDTSTLAILCPVRSEIKALGGENSRLIEFVITSDRVDREQDTLAPDGWETEDYQKNPVVLWAHDHYCPPVGRSVSLSKSGSLIKSICEFTPQDLNPFGYMIYQMYVQKFMSAVSVGFQPIEYTYAADRKYGINYIRQGLLEYSTVPVPANPDALAVARSKGIDTAPLRSWAESILDSSNKKELGDEARRRLEVLRAASSPSGRALILELGEMKMTGTDTKDKPTTSDAPPAPASPVKSVQRWECGTEGHLHNSEEDAKSCSNLGDEIETLCKQGLRIAEFVKMGRLLNDDQKKKVKEVLDSLSPAPAPPAAPTKEDAPATEESGVFETEAEGDDDNENEKGFELEMTEEALTAAVTAAVTEGLNKVTGRVD
jgi:phage head maturation protease